MPGYRIYLIDERGKIKTGFDFEGADDPSARAQADTIRGVAAAEIWERARLVARIGQEADEVRREVSNAS